MKLKKILPLLLLLALATAFFTLRKMTSEQLFFENWIQFYGMSLIIVLPVFLTIFTLMNRFVEKFLKDKHLLIQGFAFVLPMMSVMFSLMTGLSVFVLMDFHSTQEYFQLFGTELVRNIPLFLIIAFIMGAFVKPQITKRKQRKLIITK